MVDFLTTIQPAVSTALSAIIGAIVIYLGKVIADFIISLSNKHDIEISEAEVKRVTNELATIVSEAIIATNQTYVNELKANGGFTKEAQKEANKRAIEYCLNLMSVEMIEYMEVVYGDVEALLLTKIEAMIGSSKKPVIVESVTNDVLNSLFTATDTTTGGGFYITSPIDERITPV